jgi:hypothetical protein
MRRKGLLQKVRLLGCRLQGQSEKHEVYVNPCTNRQASIPKQDEVSTVLARLIEEHLAEAVLT